MDNSAVLKRTMTWKSIFHGGRFDGVPLYSVYQLDGASYLVWAYYNQSTIDYVEEILDELKITKDIRIEKPGVKPEWMARWKCVYKADMTETERMGYVMHERKLGDAVKKNQRIQTNIRCHQSKGVMQAYNHGKK